jgi:hypothetical protein
MAHEPFESPWASPCDPFRCVAFGDADDPFRCQCSGWSARTVCSCGFVCGGGAGHRTCDGVDFDVWLSAFILVTAVGIESEVRELEVRAAKARSDRGYLEELARRQGFVRKSERVIVPFVPGAGMPVEDGVPTVPLTPSGSGR